jgi:two-component system CheB/CheR fusion protein
MAKKCPVVGIGASAGGLGALKSFFDHVPDDIDAAFVIVQHLDPSHPSLTADILSRHTKLPTRQVEQGATVEAGHVYVIPPNVDLTLDGNKFALTEAKQKHGFRTPIDIFFTSLAAQSSRIVVGVILSGTGSDGTAGLKEIKAAGGTIYAQTPETAQFDGMPRSAIATGFVDVICPAEDMPARIRDYLSHRHIQRDTKANDAPVSPDYVLHLNSIIALLNARLKQDFRGYKKGTLERRIMRRMSLKNIENISDYLNYLRQNDKEAKDLCRDFLISVTSFFRDSDAFEVLDKTVLAKIVERKGEHEAIRVWVPGCATGEEAYSIAMLLFEQCENANKLCNIQIFASDIDEKALNIARNGVYNPNLIADISSDRVQEFFVKIDGAYRVSTKLREAVVFASQKYHLRSTIFKD